MTLFVFQILLSLSSATPLHVLIDAGHGGSDRGAVHNHLNEAEITLNVVLKLKAKLQNDPRFKVSLTRDRDESISLEERSDKANRIKADLFLSIHVNSSPDSRARGVEFYFQNQLPPDEESMYLAAQENAQTIDNPEKTREKNELTTIVDDLKNNHRIWASSQLAKALMSQWETEKKSRAHAIRQAPFHVISNVTMPSTLVELGFISRPSEAVRLARNDHQEAMAEKLYRGLLEYKEIIDK